MENLDSTQKNGDEQISLSISRRLRNQRNSVIQYLSLIPPIVECKWIPTELYTSIEPSTIVDFPILTEAVAETTIIPRMSLKRDSASILDEELYRDWNSRRDSIIDALLQTKIPVIPEVAVSYDEAQSDPPEMPSLNYFSNEVIYYNNGILERPNVDLSLPVVYAVPLSNLAWNSDESENDDCSIYSSDNSLSEGVQYDSLYSKCPYFIHRKDYLCPICLESPRTPVSTFCGHIFCEKCIKRLFRVRIRSFRNV